MPRFDLEIPHSLPVPEVRSRLGRATSKLETDYGATCSWDEVGQLIVARKGLHARVAIAPACVQIQLDLGLLLTPLAGGIKAGITKQVAGLLA